MFFFFKNRRCTHKERFVGNIRPGGKGALLNLLTYLFLVEIVNSIIKYGQYPLKLQIEASFTMPEPIKKNIYSDCFREYK